MQAAKLPVRKNKAHSGSNGRKRLDKRSSDTRLHPVLRAVNTGMLILLALTMALPLWNTLVLSLSSGLASMSPGLRLLPAEWSLDGYKSAWTKIELWRPFLNTVMVTASGTLLHVLFAAMAGYALTVRSFPGRKLMISFLFVTMTVPGEAILIPLYIVNKELGLLNTLTSLVLSGIVSGFSILLMRSFFSAVPHEMRESAYMDGAGDFRILLRIYVPLAVSGIATVALFEFVNRWNQFTPALLYINDSSKYTLQVALRSLVVLSDTSSGSDPATPNVRMAGIMIAVLPLLLIYPFVQKYFVQGLTAGAVKE